MKAILIREHGGTDRLEPTVVPDPELRPGEAIVRVRAVALNHLDIWVRRGVPGHKFNLPMIPGGDVAGVVDEVGGEVLHVKKGDRIAIAPGLSCGICAACLHGRDNLCASYGILGETRDGGYAEFVVV